MKVDELQIINVAKRNQPNERDVFGYFNNKTIYWHWPIDATSISIRKWTKVISKITKVILTIILILGLAGLGYHVYLNQALFVSNPILIITKTDWYLRAFYFGMLCALYLVYESQKSKHRFLPVMNLAYNVQPAPAPILTVAEDLSGIKHHDKIEVSRSFDQNCLDIIESAFSLAMKYGHAQIETVDIVIACLIHDSKIATVVHRLGITQEQLPDKLSAVMSNYASGQRTALSAENKLLFLKAYKSAYDNRLNRVTAVEIFYQAVNSDEHLKEMFYALDVSQEDLGNAIQWLRINELLVDRYHRYQASAGLRSKSGLDRAMTSMATQYLNSIAEDKTRSAQLGYLELGVNRNDELEDMFRIFETRSKNVLLVGPAGVGKSAIIEMLAERIVGDDVPGFLKEKRVLAISISSLLAGSSVSQAQQHLLNALSEAYQGRNVIVVIENVHELLGMGVGQGIDLSGILAEILNKNLFYFIATTEPQYLNQLQASALANVIQNIQITEMDQNSAIQVLESKVVHVEQKQGVTFSYQALKKIVEYSSRYMHEQYLPEKALQIMEEVAVFVKNKRGANQTVLPTDVAELLTQKLHIPISEATAGESELLLNLEAKIHERVIGQDEAVKAVSASLRRARTQLRDTKRPIANLMFLGPTGVGKTELAKAIAQVYFGAETNMIRLDMSEYQTQSDVYKMIGSRSGGEERGILTEAVRKNPFTIVLLDEVEKAYPEILDLFLQVMDDGRLTDARGQTIDFTNTVIIMTSNAGTDVISQSLQEGKDMETIKKELLQGGLAKYFRPEFINRFDAVVVFKPLSLEQVVEVAGLLLKQLAVKLEQKGIYFEASPEAIKELAQKGFDPVYGARPLRRTIQDEVDNALANFLLQGKIGRRDKVILEAGGQIRLEKAKEL